MKNKVFLVYFLLIFFLFNTYSKNPQTKTDNQLDIDKSLSKSIAFQITNENNPLIFINDKLVLLPDKPYIENELYIPLISICESLNINYKINSKNILVSKNNKFISVENTVTNNNIKFISYSEIARIFDIFNIEHRWDINNQLLELNYNIKNNIFDIEDAIANVSLIFNESLQGSCVVVDEHTVYTCWHVIKNFNYDLDSLLIGDRNIKIVGLRKVINNDLAILDVDISNSRDYPNLNKVYKWNKVTAIGFPNTEFSITKGQVTKTEHYHKYANDFKSTLENQSDAYINHGSSGGALYNSNFELIGITDAFDETHSYSLPVR
jgi:hypothetical protein